MTRMATQATNALALVKSVLVKHGSELSGAIDAAVLDGRVAAVNGIQAPIVRLPFAVLDQYFGELYAESNAAFFGGRLPNCKLRWNRRFRSLGGRIDCSRKILELSAPHFEACGAAALGIVLIHEQIHLYLYESRRPYGHTATFKRISTNLGLPSIHHEMPLPDRLKRRRAVHLYACRCGIVVRSLRRFRRPRACAACCDRHAGGRFDRRFELRFVRTELDG